MEKLPYYLSQHTFFCLADNRYVFLDLRSDKYLCLTQRDTETVKALVDSDCVGANGSDNCQVRNTYGSNANAVIQALLKKELLVQEMTNGKFPEHPNVERPEASFMDRSDKPRPRIGTVHAWNFFVASATASKQLRSRSIEHIVRAIETRKSARATDITSVQNDLISTLFEVFQMLRPYYPRPYLCLFDSLALLHFFARYSVFPQWVYGVKLGPFAAHCWVQSGHWVINDIIDNVRDYTPIMSV